MMDILRQDLLLGYVRHSPLERLLSMEETQQYEVPTPKVEQSPAEYAAFLKKLRVYHVVTDNTERPLYRGGGYIHLEIAQNIALAWNSYNTVPLWYVVETPAGSVLREAPIPIDEELNDGQMELF